ncbi:hypothetical protein GCM10009530_05770 [Microbispora corallina]|uniref:Uncharacterized protein n=1 Tax=Microbispora corallina TaxID=83302 RepID=A0ABQ4FQW0_9ACTN|nr:hypothetical protein Mco01_01970 [Microbispora corallina]
MMRSGARRPPGRPAGRVGTPGADGEAVRRGDFRRRPARVEESGGDFVTGFARTRDLSENTSDDTVGYRAPGLLDKVAREPQET